MSELIIAAGKSSTPPPPPANLVLTDSGQRLYDSINPLVNNDLEPGYRDADNGYVAAFLCSALATMLDDAAYIARDGINTDSDGNPLPPFAVLFDVDNVRAKWLPWLAQFVGDASSVTATSDDVSRRFLIKNPVQYNRGTPAAIRDKATISLTGTKTVLFNLNTGGSPWTLTVATFESETPDPITTHNAIMSVMPAWLVPTVNVVSGGDYQTLADSHGSYTDMEAAHPTYADIPANPAA